MDFPGPVTKNLPCNAGDMGFIPGQGHKIPPAKEQLSPSTTATESVHNGRTHMTEQKIVMLQLRPDTDTEVMKKYLKLLCTVNAYKITLNIINSNKIRIYYYYYYKNGFLLFQFQIPGQGVGLQFELLKSQCAYSSN